jgi:hypothetical protein
VLGHVETSAGQNLFASRGEIAAERHDHPDPDDILSGRVPAK